TASSRHVLRVQRWRRTVTDHYVICGYGTKGRSAAASLLSKDVDIDEIVIVELAGAAAEEANRDGHVVVVGDCTRESVLRRAGGGRRPSGRAAWWWSGPAPGNRCGGGGEWTAAAA